MKQEGYISHSSTLGLNNAIGHDDDDDYRKDKTLQHTSLKKPLKQYRISRRLYISYMCYTIGSKYNIFKMTNLTILVSFLYNKRTWILLNGLLSKIRMSDANISKMWLVSSDFLLIYKNSTKEDQSKFLSCVC